MARDPSHPTVPSRFIHLSLPLRLLFVDTRSESTSLSPSGATEITCMSWSQSRAEGAPDQGAVSTIQGTEGCFEANQNQKLAGRSKLSEAGKDTAPGECPHLALALCSLFPETSVLVRDRRGLHKG